MPMDPRGRTLSGILCLLLLNLSACGAQKEVAAPSAMTVTHSPREPHSGQAVTIKVTPKKALVSASLEYQVVEPGAYVALRDSEYKSRWVSLAMKTNAAEAG